MNKNLTILSILVLCSSTLLARTPTRDTVELIFTYSSPYDVNVDTMTVALTDSANFTTMVQSTPKDKHLGPKQTTTYTIDRKALNQHHRDSQSKKPHAKMCLMSLSYTAKANSDSQSPRPDFSEVLPKCYEITPRSRVVVFNYNSGKPIANHGVKRNSLRRMFRSNSV